MTAISLGGPGPGCSAARVRRLDAGELEGAERARLEEHLAGCARCQGVRRELEEERREVLRALPFERFAAGVAERLASEESKVVPLRRRALRFAPLALAAAALLGVAVPLVLRLAPAAPGGDGLRLKGGGVSLSLYVKEGGAVRVLAGEEPVPAGAPLRLAVAPGRHTHAAVVLVDADGAALLYSGPARKGLLPEAFEWTGAGAGVVLALFADHPIDSAAFAARAAREGAALAPLEGEELSSLRLVRAAVAP